MSDSGCDYENFCLELIDGSLVGVIVEIFLAIYAFVGIAAVADGYLAVGLEVLVARWRVPEDVAGASFMALGAAAPEIVVNVVSTITGGIAVSGDAEAAAQSLGVSSILGSGITAFTIIPGLCAFSCSEPMEITRRPLARDAIAYALSLGALFYTMRDGSVGKVGSVTLLVLYAIYLGVVVASPWVRREYRVRVCGLPPHSSYPKAAEAVSTKELGNGEHATNYVDAAAAEEGATGDGDGDDDDDGDDVEWGPLAVPFKPLMQVIAWTCPECEENEERYPLTLLSAFIWLAVLSALLSAVVTRWGELLSVPTATMGMLVVAVGAQVPDTIQAMAVARRGHGSMAIAGVTGSQLINVLIGLGVPWSITTLASHPVMIAPPKSSKGAVAVEQLKLMGILTTCCAVLYLGVLLLPALLSGARRVTLGRREGYILTTAYVVTIALYFILGH